MEKSNFSSDIVITLDSQEVLNGIEYLKEKGENYWTIAKEVGEFLYRKIIKINAKQVLEIGTSIGYSGIIIAEALSQTGGHLYTIESHEDRFKKATKNFKKAKVSSAITQILGHAPQVFMPDDQKPTSMRRKSGVLHKFNSFNPIFQGKSFDLVFLDATKKEHISFFKAIQPFMAQPHTIITDNIISHKEAMQEYLHYVNSLPNYKSKLLNIGAGILVSDSAN